MQQNPAQRTSLIAHPLSWALVAVTLWSIMAAVIGEALRYATALQLLAWSLAFAVPVVVAVQFASREPLGAVVRASPRALGIGLLGVLGWPAGLFIALERAPLVPANLLNYLWPVLVVAMAPLSGEAFSWRYVLAVVVGLVGAAVTVTGGHDPTRGASALNLSVGLGYVSAIAAAVCWALYTVLGQRHHAAVRGRIAPFTIYAAVLAGGGAAITHNLAPPAGPALLAAAALGIGPLALAFVSWDRAQARGSAARLGIFSYLDPLLSTLLLAVVLNVPLGPPEWVGMTLIAGSVVIAEWPALRTKRRERV